MVDISNHLIISIVNGAYERPYDLGPRLRDDLNIPLACGAYFAVKPMCSNFHLPCAKVYRNIYHRHYRTTQKNSEKVFTLSTTYIIYQYQEMPPLINWSVGFQLPVTLTISINLHRYSNYVNALGAPLYIYMIWFLNMYLVYVCSQSILIST
jgi:hypothetical protein